MPKPRTAAPEPIPSRPMNVELTVDERDAIDRHKTRMRASLKILEHLSYYDECRPWEDDVDDEAIHQVIEDAQEACRQLDAVFVAADERHDGPSLARRRLRQGRRTAGRSVA